MAGWLESLEDNIVVDRSKCTFCMTCVDRCMCDNLRFMASPCRDACPLRMNCHGYAQLIARGQEEKGLQTVFEAVPFPRILGRVCAAPCEGACARTTVDGKGVALRVLKRYLGDRLRDQDGSGLDNWRAATERPERVAIMGGGPTGLMAACCLRREGYQVVLFEAGRKPGGMLTGCIPEFRLPTPVAEEELSAPERLGAQVQLGRAVDRAAFFDLVEGFDVVLIATGASRGKRLGIPGEDLPGVVGGIDFLRAVRSEGRFPVGKRVMVIGGGNTAIDAAQTAFRLGAEEVRVACLESREEMPAFAWEVRDALEEGIQIENCYGPTRIAAKDGRVSGVEFDRCVAVFDGEGRFAPRLVPWEGTARDADMVIVAIGQEPDLAFLEGSGVEVRGGRVAVDPVSLQTSVARVFAAGDAVTGPKSVVEALAQGREAAESIHRHLQGMPLRYGRRDVVAGQLPAEVETTGAMVRARLEPPRLAVESRCSFDEIEGVISREEAVREAERCLSCGRPFGKYRTCWSCLVCEIECPEDAIDVKVPYLMR